MGGGSPPRSTGRRSRSTEALLEVQAFRRLRHRSSCAPSGAETTTGTCSCFRRILRTRATASTSTRSVSFQPLETQALPQSGHVRSSGIFLAIRQLRVRRGVRPRRPRRRPGAAGCRSLRCPNSFQANLRLRDFRLSFSAVSRGGASRLFFRTGAIAHWKVPCHISASRCHFSALLCSAAVFTKLDSPLRNRAPTLRDFARNLLPRSLYLQSSPKPRIPIYRRPVNRRSWIPGETHRVSACRELSEGERTCG